MTDQEADQQKSNPYAPPAENGPLQENQFSISLDNFIVLIRHNPVARRSRRTVLVVGILSLLAGIVLLVAGDKPIPGLFAGLFGFFLLRAHFIKKPAGLKALYDRLRMDTKVFSFQIIDDGLLIRDGRAYHFTPAEDIDRIDFIDDLAIVVKNDVGLHGIHVQAESMRSLIQKFKHDHSL